MTKMVAIFVFFLCFFFLVIILNFHRISIPQRKLSSEQETLSRLESSELSPPDTDLQKNKTTTDKIEIQNESEEESQSSSSEDENQTDEQRLDKMLDRRRKERATEKMPQTPKPDARSAAGLQDRLSNLSELHEEETWVEQEFVDLAKQARQERERRQKQELEEQTRLKESPGRISAIERARKDSMRLKSSDSVDGNGKPKGILKAVSAIGTEGLEGSSFGTPKVESKKKGIHFAEGTKKSRDAAGETESEDDSDDSKTEGETTDGETEGETTDGETDATESEEETNSEEEREDERERTELEDDIFSSRMITSKQLVSKPGIPLHPESDARVVFKFRDPDPHAVNALRREFKDCPEVQISCGDLFEDAPTCIVAEKFRPLQFVDSILARGGNFLRFFAIFYAFSHFLRFFAFFYAFSQFFTLLRNFLRFFAVFSNYAYV